MRDHLGRDVPVVGTPKRVVSLVPSITDTLLALGVLPVGRTRYCPPVPGAADVGGTKTPDLASVRALEPDLVLANKEENRDRDVAELARSVPVFVTDVRTVAAARAWVDELRGLLEGRVSVSAPAPAPVPVPDGPRAVTLVWRSPLMAVGEDTYAGDLLRGCGLSNVLEDPRGRYPRVTLDELAALRPALLVLPSEPYPWTDSEAEELEGELARLGASAESRRVPGDALTWWGTRTERALAELREALRL
ncbi:MAG TPA: helical backbone metal receptor [Planctomycetota bacterium]|nr:helical backbone metal receptor [Planctomycetota bacterium]